MLFFMLATLTTMVTDLGLFLTALTATLTIMAGTLKALSKTGLLKPLKWVFKQLIGSPVSNWHRDSIKEVVTEIVESIKEQQVKTASDIALIKGEIQTNGGSSLKDAVKRIEARQNEIHPK